jgi:oligopeptide/dipeptide ABC transporter ATP-binding protein
MLEDRTPVKVLQTGLAAGACWYKSPMPGPLLRVQDLVTSFQTDEGRVRAVDEVSFDVPHAACVGIVGESGCGKSVTALSVLRLIQTPPGAIESGKVELDGRELLSLSESEMRAVRGNEISMVFQEPMTSLNPVYTVGSQIVEALRLHKKMSRSAAWDRAVEMLRLVGIPSADTNARAYPHQLSGGMRQRVMIAMAIACEPKVLLADEPTTALDVTIQAQILATLKELRERLGMSIVLITHDLGVIAEHAEHVIVMYAARVVESGPVKSIFARPRHPYTQGLLDSIPRSPEPGGHGQRTRLPTIEGLVPDLRALERGCRFADRCAMRIDECTTAEPPLVAVTQGPNEPTTEAPHETRCIRWEEL